MKEPVIDLINVSKTFNLQKRSLTFSERILNIFNPKQNNKLVLNNINLQIFKGEVFGIIGKNGSGKSTLVNIIMGNIKPDIGAQVYSQGKIIRLSLGIGVDRNLTARENIYVNGTMIGLSFKKIGSLLNSIVEFAGLNNRIDTPVKFYSRGMLNRLLFSIAIHADADIFLLDEFFGGVGDENFKKKSNDAFQNKIVKNKTIVLVSHSLALIKKHCNRVAWLDNGSIKLIGHPETVINKYLDSNKRHES